MSRDDVAQIIFDNLGQIPHEEFGSISLMPFAVEDEATSALKMAVAQGIAGLLESAGLLAQPQATGDPERSIQINCRACSTTLFTTAVSHSGVANVPAASTIAHLGSLNLECPHGRKTLDDQRALIEQALQESRNND